MRQLLFKYFLSFLVDIAKIWVSLFFMIGNLLVFASIFVNDKKKKKNIIVAIGWDGGRVGGDGGGGGCNYIVTLGASLAGDGGYNSFVG